MKYCSKIYTKFFVIQQSILDHIKEYMDAVIGCLTKSNWFFLCMIQV